MMEPFYDSDGITIYHADCADVAPLVPPESVDLLLTDPPYGIDLDVDYSGRMHTSDKTRTWNISVYGDATPFDPSWLLRFERCVIFGANYFSDRLPVGKWIVWRKVGQSPVLADCEMAWHNGQGKRVSLFQSNHSATQRLHPTSKPATLMRWIIDGWTQPGDMVFDPYMGSGPIAQACLETGRRYIGVEIVEDYCRVAVERLQRTTMPLFVT